MSILLSLYTKDGIVFAADKNLTLRQIDTGKQTILEGDLTKVLMWPNRRAVVGFVGLAQLEDLKTDEWLRIFIAETRNFNSLEATASLLGERLNSVVGTIRGSVAEYRLMIHLGGFESIDNIPTPVMYTITNIPELDGKGGYASATRHFDIVEVFRPAYESWPDPSEYPSEIRERLEEMENRDHFLWFNNGDMYPAFNIFKAAMYAALRIVKRDYAKTETWTLFDWQAWAKMCIELHGLYYRHNLPADKRVVGGGVDIGIIPWPTNP